MKPMLAAKSNGKDIKYPALGSPKLDGIRATIIDGKVYSRTFKLIPNKWIQEVFGKAEYNGLDGELIVGLPTGRNVIRNTVSGVMTIEGQPDVRYFVFDDFSHPEDGFFERLGHLRERVKELENDRIVFLQHVEVETQEQMETMEQAYLEDGYEGMMFRSFDGKYKFGRSTVSEGGLIKLKRFEDGEAKVIGFEKLVHSGTVRPSTEDLLGSLFAVDMKDGKELNIGTGFLQSERRDLWENRETLIGKIAKYKHFPTGAKDGKRHPVFICFRDPMDMD